MCIYIKPFPDESFYSIISRYALINGISSLFSLKKILINKDKNNSRLASHDTILLIRIFSKITETPLDNLINKHTLLSLYRPFSYVNCKQSSIRFINKVFNIQGDGCSLRLCEECYLEDISRHGVAYWHRSHSVPYINFCHIHKTRLKYRRVSDVVTNGKLFMPDIKMTECNFDDGAYIGDIYEIKKSENCHILLKSDSSFIGIEELLSRYVYDLETKGIINNLHDAINNQCKPKLTSLSRKNNFDIYSVNLLKSLMMFLCAKKIDYKSIVECLTHHSDCLYNSYNTFDNMFNLCREFSKQKSSKKYAKQIRHIREFCTKRKISSQYNVHNIFEVW